MPTKMNLVVFAASSHFCHNEPIMFVKALRLGVGLYLLAIRKS